MRIACWHWRLKNTVRVRGALWNLCTRVHHNLATALGMTRLAWRRWIWQWAVWRVRTDNLAACSCRWRVARWSQSSRPRGGNRASRDGRGSAPAGTREQSASATRRTSAPTHPHTHTHSPSLSLWHQQLEWPPRSTAQDPCCSSVELSAD